MTASPCAFIAPARREQALPDLIPVANNYFHVILAGVKGGGRYLTGLRQHIGTRGYVVPSLSTRFGLKRGEYRLKTHYKNLAEGIISRAHGRPVRIFAHSLGGIEVLDLMQVLATRPDLPHQSLEVLFISPPGIGQKGVRGMREVGKRFAKVVQTLGLYDQYHLFPVANASQLKIGQKRKTFLDEWLPRIIPQDFKCEKIRQELQLIDAELLFLAKHPALEQEYKGWYHSKRHQLMKGLLEKILGGSHILEETHLHYLQHYGEHARTNIASRLAYLPVVLALWTKTLKRLYQGVDIKIVEAFEFCQRHGIDIKIGVVILGKDALVQNDDYAGLTKLALAKQIPINRYVFESEEHSSVAYNWELIDALEALECKNLPC